MTARQRRGWQEPHAPERDGIQARLNGAQQQEPHAPVPSREMLRPARAALPPGRVNADERKKQGMTANGPAASMTRRGFRVRQNLASRVAAERRGSFAFITCYLRSSAFPPCLPPRTAHAAWRISAVPGKTLCTVHGRPRDLNRPAMQRSRDSLSPRRHPARPPSRSPGQECMHQTGAEFGNDTPNANRRSVICSARSKRPVDQVWSGKTPCTCPATRPRLMWSATRRM